MENGTLIILAEAILRAILGWRMLISGLSNVRRWPNPVNTASILFPKGATFFGFVATFLMVVGGFGLAVGFQTPLCAVMIIVFLIPLALKGVKYRPVGAARLLRDNLFVYGVGGLIVPFIGIKLIDLLLVALRVA